MALNGMWKEWHSFCINRSGCLLVFIDLISVGRKDVGEAVEGKGSVLDGDLGADQNSSV